MKKFTSFLERDLLFKQMIENTNDLVVVTSAELEGHGPVIVYINRAFTRLMGYEADEIIGKNPNILHGKDTDQKELGKLINKLKTEQASRTELINYTKSGQPIWLDINIVPLYDDNGELRYFAAIERDLTDHKRLLTELEHLSRVDSLTGVSNRRFFEFRSRELTYDFKRYRTPFSLIYLDIDDFKEINDSYGHAAGDVVLKTLAKTCRELLRESDTIARLGGDEFAIVLSHTELGNARMVAERIRIQIDALQIDTDAGPVRITISAGVTSTLDGDKSMDELMKRADEALYTSKENGRNQVQISTSRTGGAG